MKRNKTPILLMSLITLCSCSEASSSVLSSSITDTTSSEEIISSVNKELIIDKSCFSIGSRTITKFINSDTIYVYKNEPYYLNKLIENNVSFVTNMDEYLSINNEGVITVNVDATDQIIKGDLFIYDNNTYQHITIVIDALDNKHQNMNIDVARLYNSNVIFFGDSITHNWLKYPNGDNSKVNDVSKYKYGELGYESNYVVQITKRASLNNAVNAAWSGGTVSYRPRVTIRPTYKSLPISVVDHEEDVKKSDYAFIFYGTNDFTDQVQIGTTDDKIDITSRNNAKFMTSYNFALNKLVEFNPNIKIIALNLLYRTLPANSVVYQIDKYTKAINDVCALNHVKVIDLYPIFNIDNFQAGSKYTEDGLHPSDEAYNIITDYILTGVNSAE